MSAKEQKSGQKSLVLINTGPGKGKTTAAIGLAVRAMGHGQKVVFLQFIKASPTGESRFLETLMSERPELLIYKRLGLGFVKGNPGPSDLAKVEEAMKEAESLKEEADLLILDEINIALAKGLIKVERVAKLIENLPKGTNLVLTGRDCPSELYDYAHTITEMKEIKHAYRQGFKAIKGVEF
ncbi:MAG: cob(I)yrinic acid a,c-diamide adenosyltransferase [Deltaproteobacteria bacterium]|jgi:cob(I)alamin adenosyltransferase|nr:cob(I)yrinic acid a,c-diamide adenosyltransferase [Deltaproteobacteria bacterium]